MWGVLPTPFATPTLSVDLDSLTKVVDLYATAGAVGLVALGVAGEAARLTESEKAGVLAAITAHPAGLPVVAGVPHRDTEAAMSESRRHAESTSGRLAAVMLQVSTDDVDALVGHLTAVHDATGLGVVLQDYPAVTGVSISASSLAETVRRCPFVVAVKAEAPPTAGAIVEVRSLVDVPVFGGLGGVGLLDELAVGAAGAMTGFSYPEAIVGTVDAYDHGGVEAAWKSWAPWLPLVNFEGQAGVGLAIRKSLLHRRGALAEPAVRPPGAALPAGLSSLLEIHHGMAQQLLDG